MVLFMVPAPRREDGSRMVCVACFSVISPFPAAAIQVIHVANKRNTTTEQVRHNICIKGFASKRFPSTGLFAMQVGGSTCSVDFSFSHRAYLQHINVRYFPPPHKGALVVLQGGPPPNCLYVICTLCVLWCSIVVR